MWIDIALQGNPLITFHLCWSWTNLCAGVVHWPTLETNWKFTYFNSPAAPILPYLAFTSLLLIRYLCRSCASGGVISSHPLDLVLLVICNVWLSVCYVNSNLYAYKFCRSENEQSYGNWWHQGKGERFDLDTWPCFVCISWILIFHMHKFIFALIGEFQLILTWEIMILTLKRETRSQIGDYVKFMYIKNHVIYNYNPKINLLISLRDDLLNFII